MSERRPRRSPRLLVAAVVCCASAGAGTGCKAKLPPDLTPTTDVHDGELAARLGGPSDLWGKDWTQGPTGPRDAHLFTVENIGKKPLRAVLGDCTFAYIAPGERRGAVCTVGGAPTLVLSALPTSDAHTKLSLRETNASRQSLEPFRFTGIVKNTTKTPQLATVSFLAIKDGQLVGGLADVEPQKRILLPGEESIVRADFMGNRKMPPVAPTSSREGLLEVVADVAYGTPATASPVGLATLSDVSHEKSPNGFESHQIGTLTNTSSAPIEPRAKIYKRLPTGVLISTVECADPVRGAVPLLPHESMTCVFAQEIWDLDAKPEVEATPYAKAGAGPTLTPLAVENVRVEDGHVRGTIKSPPGRDFKKAIVYVRATPAWFKPVSVDNPAAELTLDTVIPGATAATVTAFCVSDGS